MTIQTTNAYIIRVTLWIASIVVVAWPLHLARPAIGDIAYVVGSAIVLGGCYWLGLVISRRADKSHQAPRP